MKKQLIAKRAAKYGLRVSRKGPFRAHTFRIQTQVLQRFLKEVARRGDKLQDAATDALEIWIKHS